MTQTKIWKGAYVPNSGLVDLLPANEGRLGVQETFIPFFNEIENRMISAGDTYKLGKIGISGDLLRSVREENFKSPLITSTSCVGNGHSLYGHVIHNKGSAIVQPKEMKTIIPHYERISLDKILKTTEGLAFSKALFDTDDDAKTISETLERLTKYKSKNIVFYTNGQNYRKKEPEWGIRFSSDDGYSFGNERKFLIGTFILEGDHYNGGRQIGTSRGIKLHKE